MGKLVKFHHWYYIAWITATTAIQYARVTVSWRVEMGAGERCDAMLSSATVDIHCRRSVQVPTGRRRFADTSRILCGSLNPEVGRSIRGTPMNSRLTCLGEQRPWYIRNLNCRCLSRASNGPGRVCASCRSIMRDMPWAFAVPEHLLHTCVGRR
jgi:hypothetical protein